MVRGVCATAAADRVSPAGADRCHQCSAGGSRRLSQTLAGSGRGVAPRPQPGVLLAGRCGLSRRTGRRDAVRRRARRQGVWDLAGRRADLRCGVLCGGGGRGRHRRISRRQVRLQTGDRRIVGQHPCGRAGDDGAVGAARVLGHWIAAVRVHRSGAGIRANAAAAAVQRREGRRGLRSLHDDRAGCDFCCAAAVFDLCRPVPRRAGRHGRAASRRGRRSVGLAGGAGPAARLAVAVADRQAGAGACGHLDAVHRQRAGDVMADVDDGDVGHLAARLGQADFLGPWQPDVELGLHHSVVVHVGDADGAAVTADVVDHGLHRARVRRLAGLGRGGLGRLGRVRRRPRHDRDGRRRARRRRQRRHGSLLAGSAVREH